MTTGDCTGAEDDGDGDKATPGLAASGGRGESARTGGAMFGFGFSVAGSDLARVDPGAVHRVPAHDQLAVRLGVDRGGQQR